MAQLLLNLFLLLYIYVFFNLVILTTKLFMHEMYSIYWLMAYGLKLI